MTIASTHDAPQHGPRPLPLFLALLRSETATSPERTRKALAGLRAYQEATREPRPAAMPIVARAGRAALRDYGGTGPAVLFVPSLINPPWVLDLAEDNSLLRWLAAQGVRPLLVDWGEPVASERGLDVGGHVETMLLPLLDAVGERVSLAGYCLGGTMAIAAAALRPLRSLALIAAPWRFGGFPEAARRGLSDLWDQALPAADTLGMLPMEILQTAFWRLDPARTVGKYERFGTLDPDGDAARAFVALEDWANAGPPLTFAAARELIDDFFIADLPGRERWRIGGETILPARIGCPVLDIVSATDRIVPAASAAGIGETMTLAQGHVGMVVGSRARTTLWPKLAGWLSQPR